MDNCCTHSVAMKRTDVVRLVSALTQASVAVAADDLTWARAVLDDVGSVIRPVEGALHQD